MRSSVLCVLGALAAAGFAYGQTPPSPPAPVTPRPPARVVVPTIPKLDLECRDGGRLAEARRRAVATAAATAEAAGGGDMLLLQEAMGRMCQLESTAGNSVKASSELQNQAVGALKAD